MVFKKLSTETILKSISILTILILAGRFYYLLGFTGHLKPTAPVFLIMLKDPFTLLLTSLGLLLPPSELPGWIRKLFYWAVGILLVIILAHFSAKSLWDWIQHYWRNVFLIFMLFPVYLRAFSQGEKFNYIQAFSIFAFLNIAAAIIQNLFFPEGMLDHVRPFGLVGDPISLSALTIILIPVIIFYFKPLWAVAISAFLVGHVLNLGASVSACFSASVTYLGLFLLMLVNKELRSFLWNLRLKIVTFLLLFMIGFSLPSRTHDDLQGRVKVSFIFLAAKILDREIKFENQDEIQKFGSLSSGRNRSFALSSKNLSLDQFLEDPLPLLLGDIHTDVYQRLDFNPGVILLNWGLIACLFFYFAYIALIYKCISVISRNLIVLQKKVTLIFAMNGLVLIFILGFLNTIWYRTPLNMVLVIHASYCVYLCYSKDSKKGV